MRNFKTNCKSHVFCVSPYQNVKLFVFKNCLSLLCSLFEIVLHMNDIVLMLRIS